MCMRMSFLENYHDFSSEKRKPRAEANVGILLRVTWRSLATPCGFEVCREMLKSSAKSSCVGAYLFLEHKMVKRILVLISY